MKSQLLCALLLLLFYFYVNANVDLLNPDPESDHWLNRVKRHDGKLSKATRQERRAIEVVINKWQHFEATGEKSHDELYREWTAGIAVRIDLQGTERHSERTFERFAVQIGSRTLAVVHIQRVVYFGVDLIRSAFYESLSTTTHVFLSQPGLDIENTPKVDLPYERRIITVSGNGRKWKVSVLGVAAAVAAIAGRFGAVGSQMTSKGCKD